MTLLNKEKNAQAGKVLIVLDTVSKINQFSGMIVIYASSHGKMGMGHGEVTARMLVHEVQDKQGKQGERFIGEREGSKCTDNIDEICCRSYKFYTQN